MTDTTIDTTKVSEHRKLEFETIDDCLAELDRIAESDRRGELQTLGNWTAGQNLSHLAAWIEFGWDGYPMNKPPLPVRLVMRFMLGRILKKGMVAGVKIPGIEGGTLGAKDMETQAAAERLRVALNRLKSGELASYDSPAFGKMDHARRIKLNLRHAELHLGFLRYY
jgi:hypothetical protein